MVVTFINYSGVTSTVTFNAYSMATCTYSGLSSTAKYVSLHADSGFESIDLNFGLSGSPSVCTPDYVYNCVYTGSYDSVSVDCEDNPESIKLSTLNTRI